MKSESLVIADQQRCGEYVPGPCTHRPSRHEILVSVVVWRGWGWWSWLWCCPCGGGGGLGLLVENWIVDASIFLWLCLMKGTWWMPWHQEPMKDVGACDKPWGVGNRAVIRGCPNGET
ncbi:unnamed protein product [Phaeothamnion confervicola]